MNKKWTLHVENFAKIKSADIEISPLMCFVGENNSGKSYIMSLLWGILTYGKDIFPQKPSEANKYKLCEEWLLSVISKDTKMLGSDINIFINWFNDILNANRRLLVRKIFNYSVDIEKIEIINYVRQDDLMIKWSDTAVRYSVKARTITFPNKDIYTKEEITRMCAYICWNLLMEGIAAPLYTPMVKGRRMGEPIYLPASRTGFMLTYPQLLDTSLELGYSPLDIQSNDAGALTMPYIDFLKLILKFDSAGKSIAKYDSIVNFIETNMVKGKVVANKEYLPIIKYIPEGAKKEMPLYISSSVVSEISPLILLLKSNIKFNTIIIEEPEAHLHPRLQLNMARCIVKLVNIGIPVWITTHSDTMLQHINNMIKLNNHSDKENLQAEFCYSNEDLIDKKDIKMYQFSSTDKQKTQIVSLESTDYGFVVPTFNNALEDLLREVYAFEEEE